MDDRLDAEGSSEDEDLDALLDEVDPVESEEGISQEKLQRLEKIRMKQRYFFIFKFLHKNLGCIIGVV